MLRRGTSTLSSSWKLLNSIRCTTFSPPLQHSRGLTSFTRSSTYNRTITASPVSCVQNNVRWESTQSSNSDSNSGKEQSQSTGQQQQHSSNTTSQQSGNKWNKNPTPFHPRAFALFVLCGLGMYYYYTKRRDEKLAKRKETIGKPKIGGPFTLVDHNGKPANAADFRGKFMLIYFGFTFCPDICPAELEKMAGVLDRLEKVGISTNLVQPIMISVDPWRDTVKQVREYVQEFHPNLIGMTGTPGQVTECAKAFRVYTTRPPEVEGSPGVADVDKDYLVDHSVFMYLIDPNGMYADHFGPDKDEDMITHRIFEHVGQYEDSLQPPSVWTRLFG